MASIPASCSPLATYYNRAANCYTRDEKIDTITVHCYVGQVTAKQGCDYFATTTRDDGASCNYVVGHDGSIGVCVPEDERSGCTSNRANDQRAITIEVASESKHPYEVTQNAYDSLVKLIADICKRNGIKKLVWSTNKEDRVNHRNGCNMTVHRDYANKSCPGDYLYGKHGEIAALVNKLISPAAYIDKFNVGDITSNSVKATFKVMEDYSQYSSWSYTITDLLKNKDTTKSISVKKREVTASITDLHANSPYALTIHAKNADGNKITSARAVFSTAPSFPGRVSNVSFTVDDVSELDTTLCTLSFKQPRSWGEYTARGYRIVLAVNGKPDLNNYYDSLITPSAADKITVKKPLKELFKKTKFNYEDTLQVGVQPWIKDHSGNKILDEKHPTFSSSVYIKPKAIPVNTIFIANDEGFDRITMQQFLDEE